MSFFQIWSFKQNGNILSQDKAVLGKKMTGYVHFCQQHREAVKQVNTGMKAADVNKELNEETQAQRKAAASNL